MEHTSAVDSRSWRCGRLQGLFDPGRLEGDLGGAPHSRVRRAMLRLSLSAHRDSPSSTPDRQERPVRKLEVARRACSARASRTQSRTGALAHSRSSPHRSNLVAYAHACIHVHVHVHTLVRFYYHIRFLTCFCRGGGVKRTKGPAAKTVPCREVACWVTRLASSSHLARCRRLPGSRRPTCRTSSSSTATRRAARPGSRSTSGSLAQRPGALSRTSPRRGGKRAT